MRISPSPVRLARALCVVSVLGLAACGGGGSTGTAGIPNPGSNQICDPNSQGLQLDNPRPFSSGVGTNTNTIEIVSNGNSDQLYQSYQQFDLIVQGNRGDQLVTGPLSLSPPDNGNKPFASDFYYTGTLQNGSLQFGETYTVYLNAPNTACTAGQVGQFST